ncbi:hypothetical protein EDD15DRAFT_2271290 [Pisolithus albus]|nr:hypothetical protein EDD15DRAFT_2271290 [Pisolithus albus]
MIELFHQSPLALVLLDQTLVLLRTIGVFAMPQWSKPIPRVLRLAPDTWKSRFPPRLKVLCQPEFLLLLRPMFNLRAHIAPKAAWTPPD